MGFNNPVAYTSMEASQLVPWTVPHQAGGYYCLLPTETLLPTLLTTKSLLTTLLPTETLLPTLLPPSSLSVSFSRSSTSSSLHLLAADEGFIDGDESGDDVTSLVEEFDDKLEISQDFSEEESDEDLDR